MPKIIGVTDLQRRFQAVLDEVVARHVPYVLTRGSRPEAVLVPYEDYLRFQELEERDVLRLFDNRKPIANQHIATQPCILHPFFCHGFVRAEAVRFREY